jgi:hypothetical protein
MVGQLTHVKHCIESWPIAKDIFALSCTAAHHYTNPRVGGGLAVPAFSISLSHSFRQHKDYSTTYLS